MKKKVLFVLLCLITLLSCLYGLKWHKVYLENEKNKTIIVDYINEITASEMSHYLQENPISLIYLCITNDKDCQNFEKIFSSYIKKEALNDKIVYLNVNGLIDYDLSVSLDKLYNTSNFRNKGQYLKQVPALLLYDHDKLKAFLSSNDLTIEIVDEFLKANKIIED